MMETKRIMAKRGVKGCFANSRMLASHTKMAIPARFIPARRKYEFDFGKYRANEFPTKKVLARIKVPNTIEIIIMSAVTGMTYMDYPPKGVSTTGTKVSWSIHD
jgi:hypothetical protein